MIIAGDLNARIGNDSLAGIKQRFNEPISNDNGDLLIDLCARNNFRINNTFFDHDFKYKYTFLGSQGQKSTIDYIITNRQFKPHEILDVRTLNSANVGSDHALVLCKIRMKCCFLKRKSRKIREKFNVESLGNDSVRELYRSRLREKICINLIKNEDGIEEAWEKLKTNILQSAEEALGKRKIGGSESRNKTPWYTPEVKQVTEKKKKPFSNIKQLTRCKTRRFTFKKEMRRK